MTFVEFKKALLDAEISLPKFCKLVKINDKNLQSYKNKGDVPNTVAVIVTCFARMHREGIDYRNLVEHLQLKKQKKTGGFKKKAAEVYLHISEESSNSEIRDSNVKDKKTEEKRKETLGEDSGD